MANDLPYFPLFPSDWLLETKSLTLYEKGGLLELACSMHSSEKRGYLLFDGKPMPLERVARVLGTDKQTAQELLNTLLKSGVLERELETGVLFYPSMVNREKLRKTRQEVGKKGGLTTQSGKFAKAKVDQPLQPNCGNGSGISPPEEGGVGGTAGDDCVCEPSKFSKARIVLHHLNQSACRKYRETASNLSVIQARLDEVGGDLEGVKKMINRQVQRWIGTEQEEYLRPETLFGKQKFGSYYDNRDVPIIRNGLSPLPLRQHEPDLPNFTGAGKR